MKEIITTKRLSSHDLIYLEKYVSEISSQTKHISDIAKWLISIEIVMANFYLVLFAFFSKEKIIDNTYLIFISLLLVVVSILLSMVAVIPKKWKVNTDLIRGNSGKNELSIEEFFIKSAAYKYKYVSSSLLLLLLSFIFTAYLIFLNWK